MFPDSHHVTACYWLSCLYPPVPSVYFWIFSPDATLDLIVYASHCTFHGCFSGGASGKESACRCRRHKRVQSLGWEDPLEKEIATHSSILAWETPRAEKPCGIQSICCCCLVAQSRPALWDPMDCSTPSFPVLYHLPELAQTHVRWVSDAIQPSHPVLSPSPPAFLQSFPISGSFLMSWLLSSGGQNIATSASVLPVNIQD